MRLVRVLVVTLSDTRTAETDEAGKVIATTLEKADFSVTRHAPVRDDLLVIRELVRSSATMNATDAIVLTGGTGLAPRDVTPEAVETLYDKAIPGFGEEFRRRSWADAGANAMLSRATAGVVAGTLVFAVPGSPGAATVAAELIALVLRHAVDQATGRFVKHA